MLLVALIIISVVVLAVRRRSDARSVADYLFVAQQVTAEQAETANDLETLFATIDDVDRPEVMRRLENLRLSLEGSSEMLSGTDVPPSAAEAHGYLAVAIGSWETALDTLDDAIVLVLDEPGEAGGAERLDESFAHLRLGDLAYREFLSQVEDLDDSILVGDLDNVAFAAEERSVEYDGQLVTLKLSAVYKLGENHDVSVNALTEPGVFGERNNVPVVPYSEVFIVQAVVTNQGNEPERQVSVDLELIPTNQDEETVTIRQTVDAIEPGQARTLIFDTLDLRPGSLYELKITAQVDKDQDPENDEWRMVFYRNENA
ncbi:MAG: hypothetical protein ABFR89_03925 [Actinomycetota bacterium]